MDINVSVQYNGGLLPDIILSTRCSYIGNPFDTMKRLCLYSRCFHLNLLFGVLGPRCWTGPAMLDCHLVEGVWYIYDWDTG